MGTAARIARGFARSLVLMIGSRSILLGLVIVVMVLANRREPLGWALCVLDGLVGVALLAATRTA
jgi:hypothetical protein